MNNSYGEQIKKLRLQTSMKSLNGFCKDIGFNAGNWSRIENNIMPPPNSAKKVRAFVVNVRLRVQTGQWDSVIFAAYQFHKKMNEQLFEIEVEK